MWVRPALSGWEDTLRGDLWFCARKNKCVLEPTICPALILYIPYTVFVKDAGHVHRWRPRGWEAVETTKKDPHNMRPVWSLLVQENKALAEARRFNCVGKSSSYCCSDHIISNTRSIACANSSWHEGMSAHRLHIHNHTFTTTHFPPSLSQTHSGSSTGCSLVLRGNDFPALESLREVIKFMPLQLCRVK